jgi:hypothetical protein
MIARVAKSALIPATIAACILGGATIASASESDRRFFESVAGEWSGPGEIVAGK